MTKAEIEKALKKAKIIFDPKLTKAELEKLLPEGPETKTDKKVSHEESAAAGVFRSA